MITKEIKCVYCESVATSGVDSVERDEYYPVCDADLDRLVKDYQMMPVELVTYYDCGWCGEPCHVTDTHWGC